MGFLAEAAPSWGLIVLDENDLGEIPDESLVKGIATPQV